MKKRGQRVVTLELVAEQLEDTAARVRKLEVEHARTHDKLRDLAAAIEQAEERLRRDLQQLESRWRR